MYPLNTEHIKWKHENWVNYKSQYLWVEISFLALSLFQCHLHRNYRCFSHLFCTSSQFFYILFNTFRQFWCWQDAGKLRRVSLLECTVLFSSSVFLWPVFVQKRTATHSRRFVWILVHFNEILMHLLRQKQTVLYFSLFGLSEIPILFCFNSRFEMLCFNFIAGWFMTYNSSTKTIFKIPMGKMNGKKILMEQRQLKSGRPLMHSISVPSTKMRKKCSEINILGLITWIPIFFFYVLIYCR